MANFIDIDKESFLLVFEKKGIDLYEASERIGYSRCYLSKAVNHSGRIRESSVRLLEMTYGVHRDDFIKKQSPPHPISNAAGIGYTVDLQVMPDKLCFTVKFNGEEVVHSWCKIRGKKELDLMQAISYAAHMCYKFSEQKNLQENT